MFDRSSISARKADYSRIRLGELRKRMALLPELASFPRLTVFGAGSYARLEASKYSDIDMFFLLRGGETDVEEPNTRSLRLFGKLIEVVDSMDFPKFSNDCQYLSILHSDEIRLHLGSPTDDHANYFTARMLLLLESHCLYGEETYREVVEDLVAAYFADYPDHRQSFQPTFLLNDVCRFWKTLLLNYEHKRVDADEAVKVKEKVRNFKLKFSRMTTCFASIAALGSYSTPVTQQQVTDLVWMTPRDRLLSVADRGVASVTWTV